MPASINNSCLPKSATYLTTFGAVCPQTNDAGLWARTRRNQFGGYSLRAEGAPRFSQKGFRAIEIAELRHRDAAKRQRRRVIAQSDPVQCAEGITRRERTRRGRYGGVWPGSVDGSHLPTASASAEELIAAIGLKPRHAYSRRHLEPLQDLSRSRIDSPQIALVIFPGAVPELSVDPGDPGDEAVGLDRAKNRSCLGIDLMDLPVPILPHPERPFGPREPRVTAAAGRRNRGEHTAGLRIDLLDAILGELKQVLAVEGRSCMRGDIDRAQRLPARRIEGVQPVSRSKPGVLTVIRDSMHVFGTRKGSILTDDLGGRSTHAAILVDRQRSGE